MAESSSKNKPKNESQSYVLPDFIQSALKTDGPNAALAKLISACESSEIKVAEEASRIALALADEGADLSSSGPSGQRIIPAVLSMASESELISLEYSQTDSNFYRLASRARATHLDDLLALALTSIEAPKTIDPQASDSEKRAHRGVMESLSGARYWAPWFERCKSLLEKGASKSTRSARGRSLAEAILSAQAGQGPSDSVFEALELLKDEIDPTAMARIMATNATGELAKSRGWNSGSEGKELQRILDGLHDRGADLTSGDTPVMSMLLSNLHKDANLQFMNHFFASNRPRINEPMGDGRTLLTAHADSIEKGASNQLEILLMSGASPNVADARGRLARDIIEEKLGQLAEGNEADRTRAIFRFQIERLEAAKKIWTSQRDAFAEIFEIGSDSAESILSDPQLLRGLARLHIAYSRDSGESGESALALTQNLIFALGESGSSRPILRDAIAEACRRPGDEPAKGDSIGSLLDAPGYRLQAQGDMARFMKSFADAWSMMVAKMPRLDVDSTERPTREAIERIKEGQERLRARGPALIALAMADFGQWGHDGGARSKAFESAINQAVNMIDGFSPELALKGFAGPYLAAHAAGAVDPMNAISAQAARAMGLEPSERAHGQAKEWLRSKMGLSNSAWKTLAHDPAARQIYEGILKSASETIATDMISSNRKEYSPEKNPEFERVVMEMFARGPMGFKMSMREHERESVMFRDRQRWANMDDDGHPFGRGRKREGEKAKGQADPLDALRCASTLASHACSLGRTGDALVDLLKLSSQMTPEWCGVLLGNVPYSPLTKRSLQVSESASWKQAAQSDFLEQALSHAQTMERASLAWTKCLADALSGASKERGSEGALTATRADMDDIMECAKNQPEDFWLAIDTKNPMAHAKRMHADWVAMLNAQKAKEIDAQNAPWPKLLNEQGAERANESIAKGSGVGCVELASTLALHEEGQALSHCVLSYAENCRSGASRLFSMTLDGRKSSTLELAPHNEKGERLTRLDWESLGSRDQACAWKIVQHRGKHNAIVDNKSILKLAKSIEKICTESWVAENEALREAAAKKAEEARIAALQAKLANKSEQPSDAKAIKPGKVKASR